MEYFAARVFYEELKNLKIQKDQPYTMEKKFFNDRLFKGADLIDQESDVLNFVYDMIQFNALSQKDQGDADAGKNKALTKLELLTKNLNDEALGAPDDKKVE